MGRGRIWEKVVEPLEAAGHKVETLDLPGAGDDHTPLEEINLDLCAERTCDLLGASPEQAAWLGTAWAAWPSPRPPRAARAASRR